MFSRSVSWGAAAVLAVAIVGSEAHAADNESIPDPSADDVAPYAAGHGSVSMGYQQIYSHGDYEGPASKDSGNVHFNSMEFEANYFVADRWEIHVALPYIESSYSGNFAHPLLPCPPNCQPTKIDDGAYHGYFQDWDAGVRYHTDLNGYEVTPSLDIYVPSNNYPFYGSAGIGQRTTRVGVGVDLSHQFDASNFFYDAHYQYVFNDHVLHIDNNFYTFGIDVGYLVSPVLSVKAITDVKLGNGYDDNDIGPYAPGPGAPTNGANPIWELHDKFRLEEHADIGGGLDYSLGNKFLLSATVAHSVWGRANARLTYDYGLKLTRSF
jgi:hypothetical protein